MSTDDTQATSAAREPSDAEVLAGAAALMKDDPAYEDGTYGIDDYLAMSRAVLLAARASLAKDQEQQEREARRQRFNVAAEAVERRKAEMTAAELKYRRATATPDHPLAEPDHTGNGPHLHFSRGLSYPDPVDWSDEEEGEASR